MTSASSSSNNDRPTSEADEALFEILATLASRAYYFVTPTPATHRRVISRPQWQDARDLRDIFGWSLPFRPQLLDADLRRLLDRAGALDTLADGRLRSRYRVSSLRENLYLHSAFPTDAEDAVFFGPDSYRFTDMIASELAGNAPRTGQIVDIGAGAGVGAIVASRLCPDCKVTMTDINPEALRLARINARAAGVKARTLLTDDLSAIDGMIDVALANPPYIVDRAGRDYRDGGGMHGGEVALDMARTAIDRLARDGRLLLYTGSAIVAGKDSLRAELDKLARRRSCTMRYREIDPDVFGEELNGPAYQDVERIAVVRAVIARRAGD
jgi:methylase of polypeptide subunit release factors